MNKAFISLLTIQALLLLSNCCGPKYKPPPHFIRTGMSVQNMHFEGNYPPGPLLWTGDMIVTDADLYGLGVKFDVNYVAQEKQANWGNSAFADTFWSCGDDDDWPGAEGSREHFTFLEITSTSTFDAAHLPGTLLNDLFFIYHNDAQIPVDSIIGNGGSAMNLARNSQYLQLISGGHPTADSTFYFTVKLGLSDGTIMEATSPKVTFRP